MIYDLFLALFVLIAAPKILWQKIMGKKRFCSLTDRFGKNPPHGKEGRRIWIHAVSVGEIKAAQPFLHLLRQSEPDACILVTMTTATGYDEARRTLGKADLFRFFPLDFSWIMRRWIRTFSPDLLLFIEGDIWPNLIAEAKQAGVKTALLSGKMSERSLRRLRFFPFLARRLYGSLDALCVQNEEHRRRFFSLVKRPIAITGNLKLDIQATSIDPQIARSRFALAPGQVAVTLSCTHAPEEKELLVEMLLLWEQLPDLVLLLAPRHPERFEAVAVILRQMGLSFCRFEEKRKDERVILVDAMGQLPICYAASSIAIVAGSFSSKVGGHNILEPLFYGCPVLFGPEMQKQREFAELAVASGAGWQISSKELSKTLCEKISIRETLQEKAQLASALERGSAERTLNEIKMCVLN